MFEIVFGSGLGFWCPFCATCVDSVELRRRNTAYVDDELNWLIACEECHQADFDYYAERWADYYQGLM